MRFGILIFLSFVFTSNLLAQPMKSLPREMMLEVAEEQLEYKDYYHALEWFEKAYDEERELSVAKQIADIHLKLRDYRKAESWYKRVLKQDKLGEYSHLNMQYAQLLKINGKYEEALPAFATIIDSTEDQNLIKLAYNEIKGIEAYGFSPAPVDIIVEGLERGVNSSFSEYSPNIDTEGNIYFSSYQRKNVIIEGEKDEDPKKKKTKKKKSSTSKSKKKNSRSSSAKGPEPSQFANIYTTTYDEKKKRWNKPTELGQEINRPGYHTSNVYITEDGRRMYFTRALLDGNEVQESKIHVSFKDGSNWGPSEEVKGVNGNFLSKAPVMGEIFGAEVMFFASDMDGGKGGDDIYYASRISDTEFGIPTNLGESINTPGNEATPFFRETVLHFSSDGHPGLGGLDIFKSSWNGAQWEDVENLGKGYNTSFDDHFYRLNTDGSRGFLVSNRPGTRSTHGKTCCDDIFEVKLREFKIDLLSQVLDEEGPLPGATMTLVSIENNDIGSTDSQSKPDSSIFRFPLDRDVKYRVEVTREGYYPGSYEFNTVGLIDDQTIKKVITLEPIPKPEVDPNEGNDKPKDDVEIITTNTPIRMSNIYYDLNDAKILPDAETDLYKILGWMQRYPDMVVELSSHTDSQGKDRANERLSQRRSESAKNWLVNQGINPNRIQAVGYGEQFILNRCVNGVQCSDDEHRFNRRTEFKIISGPQTIEVKKEVRRGSVQGNSGIVAPPKNYKLTFDKEKVSLGRVRKGTKKSTTYKFQNTGDEPVEIELITSCDCTTVTWDEGKIYQPGEMGEIKITFDSTKKNKSETIDVDVILRNNDPETGYPMVYILQFYYELVK